ncbi:PREDICTED: eukaryotic translation initiation factor 2A [Rhagoletis zephyria]|uniref:eukaryotic translation initiation factor 2A n=1 Tax=Rhagoletis zephyria TaxID=28612 RepID=UPI0008117D81|nr:PREDICTED: eukaryotic translation initiation factor 2A [Rhagoletis zephyria]
MALDSCTSNVSPALAVRSSVGVELWVCENTDLQYVYKSSLPREETRNCRSISFSSDGHYFAYSNGNEVKVLNTLDWKVKCTLPRPKAFYLKFSPIGNYISTWELYTVTKDKPEGSSNMFIYDLSSGSEVFDIVQKNQTDWEPSWSTDESLFAIVIGGEALFYDLSGDCKNFNTFTRKIGGSRGAVVSLSPGASPPCVAVYTPGAKGGPSMCKLYKYPSLSQNQAIACKSFFQADRVDLLWNKRGSGILLLTSTEVDKSGASYYGNQALHFMATKGDSCSAPLSKEGPVHCVKWSPKATEFVVVYGFMPSKAALYNLKCDVVYDFGEGPRNCAFFNPFGNLLALAGFGNLPGNVEIWDIKKKEILTNIKCPDTTYFEWNPNGIYFITATTAPRLRIGNGFKVYHYSGALVHETIWPQGQELLGIEWQKYADGTFEEPIITKVKLEGIKSSLPEASNKAYTPPHLRMLKEGKDPEQFMPRPQGKPNVTLQGSSASRKGGLKSMADKSNKTKNKKELGVAKSGEKNLSCKNGTESTVDEFHCQNRKHKPAKQVLVKETDSINVLNDGPQEILKQGPKKSGNPEKEKKIRHVAKKLSDIKKLKLRQEQGETLELNQLNKISMEAKFLEELKILKMTT